MNAGEGGVMIHDWLVVHGKWRMTGLDFFGDDRGRFVWGLEDALMHACVTGI